MLLMFVRHPFLASSEKLVRDLRKGGEKAPVICEDQLSAFDLRGEPLYATLVAGLDFSAVCIAYSGL
jgi:hypothetical protein